MGFSDISCYHLWRIVIVFMGLNHLKHVEALGASDIIFVIMSQPDPYHAARAETLRQSIVKQVSTIDHGAPIIKMVHEEFPTADAWTIAPLLPWLVDLHGREAVWAFFLEEKTGINVQELLRMLEEYNPNEDIWIGHGLFDEEPTIIHHFASRDSTEFTYPLLATGFVMSMNLIKSVVKKDERSRSDFSIDASHEFALHVGQLLVNIPDLFCLKKRNGCVTYLITFSRCGTPVMTDAIFFAVKTCLKFHNKRIPIVKKTWGEHAKHIEYFSHLKDEKIPTTDVGVMNTERGHCAKMFKIFQIVLERVQQISTLEWLVLSDDDTLLSVSRMQELLSCWNSSEPVAIGERYGYNVKNNAIGGYNYLTGGGSIAISIVTLKAVVQHCSCHTADTPDDMYLGICLTKLNIPLVHSSDFHQGRPDDYASDYLAAQRPVSFHKHWMINPISTYKKWFKESNDVHPHSEL